MMDIRREAVGNAPVHVVFEYVADYRTVPGWMFGMSRFEPVGGRDYGLGAVFEGR